MTNILRVSEAASMAMHTMVLLAVDAEKSITTREAAKVLRVSEAHLSKVMQRLTKSGLLRSTRGPKGGFALARKPETVTLLEVYEAIEGPLLPSGCLFDSSLCDGKNCILGDLLGVTNKAVSEYLTRTRLTDVTSVFENAG